MIIIYNSLQCKNIQLRRWKNQFNINSYFKTYGGVLDNEGFVPYSDYRMIDKGGKRW